MAQSALTVTVASPSPPTNFSCTGATPPNVPNYTKTTYANPFNLTADRSGTGASTLAADARPQSPYGVNPSPPPYFDDAAGGVGTALAFAANTAALASGTGATSGGTENTFPGIGGLTPPAPNMGGAVPASTSVAHEGAGQENVVTQTYATGVFVPGVGTTYLPAGGAWTAGDAGGPLRTFSAPGTANSFNGVSNSPNQQHASSLSPLTNPVASSLGTPSTVSGVGTTSQTVVGTNFTRQSVVWVNGVAQATTFTSATLLTCPTVTKKTSAGTWQVMVITGGVVQTPTTPLTWTFT